MQLTRYQYNFSFCYNYTSFGTSLLFLDFGKNMCFRLPIFKQVGLIADRDWTGTYTNFSRYFRIHDPIGFARA